MAEFNKSKIIHNSRIYHKFTRAAASEGICDELTLLRYEKGHLSVSPKNFHDIMGRMGEPGETIILPYTQDDSYIIALQDKISISMQKCDYVECEKYLSKLINYDNFNMDILENKQYASRIQLSIDYAKGTISAEERIVKLIEILQYTFPDYNGSKFPPHKIFTECELLILNTLASTYRAVDRIDLTLSLFNNLFSYCKAISNKESVKPLYKILLNYSNLLGQIELYEKSIEVSNFAINWLKKRDMQNLLYNFYYNIGWCLLSQYNKNNDLNLLEQGKTYIWLSYTLCNFFPESTKNRSTIKALIENNYILS